MKCPKCGFHNVDWAEICKKCDGSLNPLYTRFDPEIFPTTDTQQRQAEPPSEPPVSSPPQQLQTVETPSLEDEVAEIPPTPFQEEEQKEPYVPTPFRPQTDEHELSPPPGTGTPPPEGNALPPPTEVPPSEVEIEREEPVAQLNSGSSEAGAVPDSMTPIPEPHVPEEEVVLEDEVYEEEVVLADEVPEEEVVLADEAYEEEVVVADEYDELRELEDYEDIVDERELISFDLGGIVPRIAAMIVDYIVIIIITAITIFVAFQVAGKELIPEQAAMISGPIYVLVFLLYFIVLNGYGGQTLGKMLFKIKVIGETGDQIGLGRSVLRCFGYIVSSMVFGLGFIWALFDSNRQTWHDKIAKTYVVRQ